MFKRYYLDEVKELREKNKLEYHGSSEIYGMIMTSTQVDEDAQHFYRKLGYKDCGGLTIDIPGYEQPMEMFMNKIKQHLYSN